MTRFDAPDRRRLLLHSAVYTIGTALPQAINLLVMPVVTRYLTPEEYGIFAYTSAISLVIQVLAGLSIHSFVMREYVARPDPEDRARLFGTTSLMLTGINLAVLTMSLFILPRLFTSFGLNVPFVPYMRLACIIAALDVMSALPLAYLRMAQKPLQFTALAFANVALGTGLGLWLIVGRDMGLLGRYYGLLISGSLMLVVYLVIMARVSVFRWDGATALAALAFCLPLVPAALMTNIQGIVDRFILERYMPLEDLGIYAVGFALGNAMALLSSGIYRAIEPEIYRLAETSDFHKHLLALKRGVVAVLLPSAFALMLFAREIVSVFAAPAFRDAYRVTMLIAAALLIQGIAVPAHCYLIAVRKTGLVPIIAVGGMVLSVGLNLLLIPRYGVYGAGIAAAGSATGGLLILQAVTQRIEGLRWRYGKDLLAVALVCALATAASRLSTGVLRTDLVWKALVAGVAVIVGCKLFLADLRSAAVEKESRPS